MFSGSFIIAYDRFKETGTAFQFHGMAGVEWPLSRGFNRFVEGRYRLAYADPDFDDAYNDPVKLDQSGGAEYLGGSIHY